MCMLGTDAVHCIYHCKKYTRSDFVLYAVYELFYRGWMLLE